MYTEQMYENSLCHYGVKGQKWGERRFQNLDGTYTALGERRRLETLARTGTTVRPTSALANRQSQARTGNVVRVNSVNRTTTSKPGTTGGATKLVLDRTTGTDKRIPAVTTGSKALKKVSASVTKPTARLVTSESSQKAKKKLAKAQQGTEATETTATTTSTSTGTKKKKSSSKKKKTTKKTQAQKEAEQKAKEAEEQKAKEQEQQNQEEKKDETQNEGSQLTEEQVQDYARRVIRGEFGNGQERKDKLGDKYAQVQALVNAILLKGKKK